MLVCCFFLTSSCKKKEKTPSNNQPSQPKNPSPADSAKNISTSTVLSWTYPDPEGGNNLEYDIWFGSVNPPNHWTQWLKKPNFTLVGLEKNCTYYWNVTVWKSSGLLAYGPTWRFTTNDCSTRTILFQDDFESYMPNTFPSSGGWIANAGASHNVVSDSVFHSSKQSFKLTENVNFPDCYRKMSIFPTVTYMEVWIKTPSNITPSDGGLFYIGIRDYFAISFNCINSTINLEVGDYYGSATIELEKFLPGLWYKVNLKFDKLAVKITCCINDIQKYQGDMLPDNPPTSLDFVCISQNLQKDVFLDDLIVWYE